MDGGNAWDLVGGAGGGPPPADAPSTSSDGMEVARTRREEREWSKTPSHVSKLSEVVLNLDDIDLETINQQILEEEAAVDRKKRSQSPAMASLRKVSQQVLRKIGVPQKKRPRECLLFKRRDIPELKFEDVGVVRPHEYFQKAKWFNFRTMQSYTVDEDALAIASGNKEYFPEDAAYQNDGMSASMLGRGPYEYDPYCPVHGSRRRLGKGDKGVVTVQSLMNKFDDAQSASSAKEGYLYSQEFIAKCIRKQKRAALTGPERRRTEKILRKIKANLWIISVAFLFLFTAFHGLQNLQTSVNGTMGSDSLMVLYASLAVSSLFVPSFMINRLGCKQTLIASIGIYVLYHFAQFLPQYYSLVPVSVLAGVAGSCLWGAKCAYITECGIRYAQLNIEAQSTVIVRFFGYFFMVVHLGQVLGNIISAFIFSAAMAEFEYTDMVIQTCGYRFPFNESMLVEPALSHLSPPTDRVFAAVCAAYLGCAIVAVLIVAFFLNALHKDVANRACPPQFTAEVLKLMLANVRNIKMYLLVPLTIFNGLEQAFIVGVFTKAFVGCGLGVPHIGVVMTAFGVSDAICSLVFGPLIKLFGRMPLFVFGAVVNIMMICTLVIWSVNSMDTVIFYVIAGVWGMADGVWNTQVNGIWVGLVGRQSLEFAFASYRFWESLGLALGFLLIRRVPSGGAATLLFRVVTVHSFLLIAIGLLLVGMAGYIAIEMFDHIVKYLETLFAVCLVRRKAANSMHTSLISRGSRLMTASTLTS